ncbi:MAG: hypothetical protein AVDCRST_MAG42-38 [uncultured Chthoniobacterales bacterium]|uniref:Uncharacterized protein n=1 Tax=uncultured Chthoniobacterales bacterium TaxID=1836801 RepID=A0A6J4H2N2_9BACT|nr:MAG: hypothetical protein AVDCRST_MAG42-38 [uncultured Chthoniobacterales bacterium]
MGALTSDGLGRGRELIYSKNVVRGVRSFAVCVAQDDMLGSTTN